MWVSTNQLVVLINTILLECGRWVGTNQLVVLINTICILPGSPRIVVWQELVLVGLLLAWCPVNEGIRYLGPFGIENEKAELMLEINSFQDVLVTIGANYPLPVTKHYLTLALQAMGPENPG